MRISKLRLKNFRCFENLELSLNQNLNILIGVNGAGKSTILDGLAIALGGYLSGFDNIRSNYIQQEDVHYKMFEAGSRIDAQEQFPVEVYAKAEFDQRETRIIEWQRELNGIGRRTTHGNLKLIVEHAKFLQDEVRSGRKGCVLPLVAYYGTGRLWLQKRNRTTHVKGEKLNRQMAYVDCIAAESNEKQMVQWFEDMTYIQLQEGHAVPELEAVKRALRKCYLSVDKNVTDAKFAYNVKNHELEITIFRDDSAEKFPVRMLSDGEKGIISLVADIAYRMALLNPDLLENVLETPGVVLIDEIDMHLHPMWQKKIVADLTNTFPNVQFVMTTHSPSILVNVPKENIWVLDRFKLYQPESKTYGKTVGEVLQEVMDINVQPDYILELQKEFDDAI
ncbi:MAG: AAA family ATPase [Lachnospiraceae bacterium]|nr:AAA family ATPase [Lachnospiraceae bacterium]